MSWSYDPAALEKSLNWVRFRVGDTDTNDQQVSDEEVSSLIALHDDKFEAAAAAASAISAKYARFPSQEQAELYAELAETIRRERLPVYL